MKRTVYFFAFLLLLVVTLFTTSCKKNPPIPTPTPAPTPTPNTQTVSIFENHKTEFQIVYSADSVISRFACNYFTECLSKRGITVKSVADNRSEEEFLEILIGPTDRALSEQLESQVEDHTEPGGIGWGFRFENGKFAIYATKTDAYYFAIDELFSTLFDDEDLKLQNHFIKLSFMTEEEYLALSDGQSDPDPVKLSAVTEANKAFQVSDFGSAPLILNSPYPAPAVNPTKNQHPRVLFTKSSLDGIRAAMRAEESQTATALYRSMVEADIDGKLPVVTEGSNFDGEILAAIEAKALEYVLTGNTLPGYEAVVAIKNFILTLNVISGSDLTRQWGQTMLVAAEVYDWCYPLLGAADREQIIRGVENIVLADGHMEMGFPPSGQTGLTSHGAEAQLLRDYMAFAIAVYDERPDFWAYVGGRFYQDFVPFRNYYYESGLAPQGSGLYGQYRHTFDLWAAWLIKTMSGINPFSSGMEKVIPSFLAAETPFDKQLFTTGDFYGDKNIELIDKGGPNASVGKMYGLSAYLFHSALYDNGTSRAAAKYYSEDFTEFSYSNNYLNPVLYLILSSTGTETATDRHEGLPTVLYNGSPVGMLTSREAWNDPDSVAVMMKIGERTTANHEHQDAGSFNIYYKGKLAFDSGVYGGFGSDHHYYYHQATVAHNSLLIYNPALGKSMNGWYSGGQKQLNEAANLPDWNTSKYDTGKVTGVSYGYTSGEGKKPTYAYLAGDITPAYDSITVSEVERRMLTVYTDDEAIPAIFVVYDNITAKSGNYKKTFLLHTAVEPTVSGRRVTVVNGDGKLTLFNLSDDEITTLGGPLHRYEVVNGKTAEPYSTLVPDDMWGRVEISPALGNATDTMLNVCVISDADATVTAPIPTSNADLEGFVLGKTAVFFAKTSTPLKATEVLNARGSGELTYYFSGVAAGTWSVSVSGRSVGTFTVRGSEGLLTFTAPAGTVTITPRA